MQIESKSPKNSSKKVLKIYSKSPKNWKFEILRHPAEGTKFVCRSLIRQGLICCWEQISQVEQGQGLSVDTDIYFGHATDRKRPIDREIVIIVGF